MNRLFKRNILLLMLAGVLFGGLIVDASTTPETQFMARVEQQLGQIKTLQVDFEQQRTLKLLKNKAIFTGKIFMEAPGKLAWHVYKPIRYSCIINGDIMTQWDADSNEVTTINAKKIGALQLVIRQLQYWFAGNFTALNSDFESKVMINTQQIEFIPKASTPPARFIKKIIVTLKKDLSYIKKIVIYEEGGDTMTMLFAKTIINKPLPDNVWKIKGI
ncbi:MAG: outer membrane lipoprotein carrier protein LolA [Victivallaceae bacterium]|nr:outer membrane lipoprotein carrier protein LolA [Victivallaceae bacterium]